MEKPNLLFVFSDQHARKVAGCYGDPHVHTPNLDWLAAEGAIFDNAYCPSPLCVPSRMSMLTSRWPYRQQCWTNDDFLRSDLPTWPMSVGKAGLRPALVGRMHANGPDQHHGYSERLVGDHVPNWPGVPRSSLGVLRNTNDPQPESLEMSGPGGNPYQIKDTEVTATAVDWLKSNAREELESGRPFCLTVGYMLPHPPYVVDADIFNRYDGVVGLPEIDVPNAGQEHAFHNWWRNDRGIADVSDKNVLRARAAYWGMVHRLDENIGHLLAALNAIDQLDNTLIVYASDHGDHLGNRGLWWKHTFYEESVKVPIVMRLPNVVPSGQRTDIVVNLIDLSQTMLEAMGAQQLPNADGKSFWSAITDNGANWSNSTFSEYCTDEVPDWTGRRAIQQRMFRSGPWKLVLYNDEEPQLFNLDDDPTEQRDLATEPKNAVLIRELTATATEKWQPVEIRNTMRLRRQNKDFVGHWAKTALPESKIVWDLTPDLCWLGENESEQ